MVDNNSKYKFQSAEEIIPLFQDKPVFLGWGKEYNLSEEIHVNSKIVFEFVKNGNFMYLNDQFINNAFYHPLYINIVYKETPLQETLKTFFNGL